MKKFRKMVGCVLTTAMIFGLAGCGGTETAQKSEEVKTADGSMESKDKKEPITIEYWNVNNETFGGPAVEELVNKFNETNDQNIKVINKYVPNNYQGISQNLQVSLAADIYPGVVQVGYNYLNYFAENFPQYTPPNELIENFAPEDKGYLEKNFLPNVLNLGTAANGTMLGVPYSISVPLVYINADIFKAAGLDPDKPPVTWDEVLAAAKTIKEKTGNYGFYFQIPSDTWADVVLMGSNGAEMYEMKEGKANATFNSPESVEAYTMLQSMYKNGEAIHVNNEDGVGAFVGGKIGMVFTSVGRRSYFEENCNFDLRTTMVPSFGEKDRYICAGGNMLVTIAKTDEEKKACWEFTKFMLENESLTTWTKSTGYLPPKEGVAEDPNGLKAFFEENELMKPALESLKSAMPWTSWPGPNGLQVEQVLIDLRDSILGNLEDVETCLKTAEDKINSLMTQ